MEFENDRANENGSNTTSTSASDDTQRDIAEGLYVLMNKKARTLLNLSGGVYLGGDKSAELSSGHDIVQGRPIRALLAKVSSVTPIPALTISSGR